MEDEEGTIVGLIHKAVDSTAGEVDPRLLKSIKSVARYSDSEVRIAAQTLMLLMRRNHSQVRYLSLLIMDELFMRSKLFRSIIVENMDQLLTLSVGFRRSMPLPAPPAIASCLRSKAMEFLEKWNSSYGVHYRQLRLGFDYLKNTLRLQFPDLRANAARIEQERREREMRSREILSKRFDDLRANIPSIKEEVESMILEIERCLDIIRTEEEGFVPLGPFEDEDFDEFRSRELLQIRLESLKEGEKLQENKDNKVVFDALRELYKLLVMKHLVSVQESITVAVRVDVLDNRVRDSTLKELINIQNDILSVKKKCNEGVSVLSNTNKVVEEEEEEEDFWEEGNIEIDDDNNDDGDEGRKSGEPAQSSIPMKDKLHESSTAGETAADDKKKMSANPLKEKLLAEAPVVTWGSNLEIWEGSRGGEVLANQRGLDLESHWGRVDKDAVIPAEKIAELNLQATLYKEERVVPIQPCLAPLVVSSSKGGRGGGLCQRRDLKVCPFHGPIVPRDSEGNPINENETTAACSPVVEKGNCNNPPDQKDIVKRLAEEAVKNVRQRDRDEAERRIEDKKMMKRAKLAKVRAHNEVVLRDAALASTSMSAAVGEDMDEETVGNSRKRNKKQKKSLASMLKKKVTAKDRLQQRLLHSQPTADGTRLESDGDRRYREAFPNQW